MYIRLERLFKFIVPCST